MEKRETFTYDSRDGITKVHAVKWMPKEGTPRAVLQIVHGMTEHMGRYDAFAAFLNQKGFLVTGNDHLGHGKSRREEKPFGYFCKRDAATVLVRDVHRLKKIVQEENPGVPYFILGHSMGSFLLRNYLLRYGKGIDGAIIMGTGNPDKAQIAMAGKLVKLLTFLRGPEYVSDRIQKLVFGKYNSRIEGCRTESDWLSRDSAVVDDYLSDTLCRFSFTLNGYAGLFELIKRASESEGLEAVPKKLPVLFMAGEADPVGAYGKGVEEVYNTFVERGFGNVDKKLYPGCRHEILNEWKKEQIWEDVTAWLNQVLLEKESAEE